MDERGNHDVDVACSGQSLNRRLVLIGRIDTDPSYQNSTLSGSILETRTSMMQMLEWYSTETSNHQTDFSLAYKYEVLTGLNTTWQFD